MDLEIYDKDLSFIGVVDNFTVLKWHRKYFKVGSFELKCPATPQNIELLTINNVVYKSNEEAGIIQYRNLILDNDGEEQLIVKGLFLAGLLKRRIIWGRTIFYGNPESLMRKLVDESCINAVDSNRNISLLSLAPAKGLAGESINFQGTGSNILDTIEKNAIAHDLGFRINFKYNTQEMEFEIYRGLDRTDVQSVNPKALFSVQYENILEQDYVESFEGYYNTALIAGAGEWPLRKITSIETGVGLERYESFVDARDLSETDNNEVEIPLAIYEAMLNQRGIEKLSESQVLRVFDSVVNTNPDQKNLVYKVDYDLGDKVTVFNSKWNISIDTQITEIEEIYQNNSMSVNVIFGNDLIK